MSPIAIDFTRYQTPGIYTEDVVGPQLRPRTSVPTAVAILGLTRGYRLGRESLKINPDTGEIRTIQTISVVGSPTTFTLTHLGEETSEITVATATGATIRAALEALNSIGPNDVQVTGSSGGPWEVTFFEEVPLLVGTPTDGTSPEVIISRVLAGTPGVNRTLNRKGILTDSLVVKNINTGEVYLQNTDYTVVRTGAGEDVTPNTRDDLYTIARVIDGGHIEPGDIVQVEYNYTDPDYFKVYNFYDFDDLRDFYGNPFDSNGNITSELSLAAYFAMTNGATTIMAVAVDPVDPQVPTIGDYKNALDKLRDESQIAIIVPATGQTPLHTLVQQHVSIQSENRYERRAILGMDGTVTPISSSQRIIAAQTLTEERIALVSPTTFDYYVPELNRVIQLGGQFVAAAVAGLSVSRNAAWPLTRKIIRGFSDVTESQRDGQKSLESQNGLMVVEKNKRNLIWVRHGVTTDPTDLLTSEWSIIGQRDVMVYRIRDYLDADGLIGQPILPETILNVKASANSALESLVRDKVIVGYRDLKIRQIESMPDVLEVRYQWRPAYPLNYIVVRYSVDIQTGEVASNTATSTTV